MARRRYATRRGGDGDDTAIRRRREGGEGWFSAAKPRIKIAYGEALGLVVK
jgi:hypothetical protein